MGPIFVFMEMAKLFSEQIVTLADIVQYNQASVAQ